MQPVDKDGLEFRLFGVFLLVFDLHHLGDAEFEGVLEEFLELVDARLLGEPLVVAVFRVGLKVYDFTVVAEFQVGVLVADFAAGEKFFPRARLVERDGGIGPEVLGYGAPLGTARLDGVPQESADIVHDGGGVEILVLLQILVHVAYEESFGGAHELAEERIAVAAHDGVVAGPGAAGLAQVQRVGAVHSGEIRRVGAHEEQVLRGYNPVGRELHEGEPVDEQVPAAVFRAARGIQQCLRKDFPREALAPGEELVFQVFAGSRDRMVDDALAGKFLGRVAHTEP